MDGSIYIDKSVPEGSELEQKVIKHESDHAKRMKTGELSYGDDWVRFRGVTYPRKDGQILYKGKWREEGDDSFEWEKLAEKAFAKDPEKLKTFKQLQKELEKHRK